MNNYILIAVAVLIIMMLIGFSCRTCGSSEYFSDFEANMIKNGKMNGYVSGSTNFKIVELSNPSKINHVLEQSKFDNKGYTIQTALENNSNYSISYWRSNDDLYNAKNYDIEFYNGDDKIITEGHVVCNKLVNGKKWKKVRYYIATSFDTLTVIFGAVGSFTQGVRYYADLKISKYYPKLDKYKYHDNLKTFYLFTSEASVNKNEIRDLTDQYNITFEEPLKQDSYGVALNKLMGSFSSGDEIFNENNTVIFTYTPEENQNGSLLMVHAINDSNNGINIDFQTSMGVENYVSISISNVNYIYNIGLITNPIMFSLVLNNNEPILYINNHITKPIKINTSGTKLLGTCPDGFRAVNIDGEMKCQDISNIIPDNSQCKGKAYHSFTGYKDSKKQEWAKSCMVNWKNCKVLNDFEIAPTGDSSCKSNNDMLYSSKSIIVNKDKTLTGRLHNLIVYNNSLELDILTNIYKYLMLNMIKPKSEDNCCSRPSLIKESSGNYNDMLCPFENKTVCSTKACKSVEWGDNDNLKSINGDCKEIVNNHCKNNDSDRFCNKLRELKKLNNKYTNPKIPDSLTKAPVINNIANCKGCESKVDLTKYIKKDKIPCWGCNLGDVENKPLDSANCSPKK
jgi:hypothetical protein